MFLCLPENQVPYPHQKVLFPKGGGYWGSVIKDGAAPMFIATVQPEGEPASERVTAMFADVEALRKLRDTQEPCRVVALHCVTYAKQQTNLATQSIEEVWVRSGRYGEKLVLKMSGAVDTYLDGHTMKPVLKTEGEDWVPLLEITASSAKRGSRN
ncbi:hypothetical protein O987_28265 [Comamonas testosteroni TK102]|uniref:Uncharacterized protein n=1 Tax=Comamonas testosteroni TK102 TaxID=1392005 RepID=A0A076PVJ0_COMTE|nr:hypothetical protein O987_28265 [Comamonas testosteroni TK102]